MAMTTTAVRAFNLALASGFWVLGFETLRKSLYDMKESLYDMKESQFILKAQAHNRMSPLIVLWW